MPRPTEYRKRVSIPLMVDAIQKGGGIVAAVVEVLQQAGHPANDDLVRRYIKRYPACATAVERSENRNLDIAESKLLTAITKNEDWAIKFYLETKGKVRGYTKRSEIAGVPGAPLMVTDAREWLTDQLDQMESRLRQEPSGTAGPAGPGGTAETPTQTVH
jgi:hypothetical protein